MRYKTLKEEPAIPDKWKVGKLSKYLTEDQWAERINITGFCPTSLCNLFHADDMAEILIRLRQPFVINYWSRDGRDNFCQISIENGVTYSFEVFGSGYGTGDWIRFEKTFPEKEKFRICREMAIHQNRFMENYHFNNIERDKKNKRMKSYALNGYLKHGALSKLLYSFAKSIENLRAIAELYHLTENKSFYDKYGKKVPELEKKLGREKQFRESVARFNIESVARFNEEWSRLVKSGLCKKYLKALSKEKEAYEKEVR